MRPGWTDKLSEYVFGAADHPLDDSLEDDVCQPKPKRQRTHAEEARRAHRNDNFNDDRSVSKVKAKKIGKVLETRVTEARVNQSKFCLWRAVRF